MNNQKDDFIVCGIIAIITMIICILALFGECGEAEEESVIPTTAIQFPIWYTTEGTVIHTTDNLNVTNNIITTYSHNIPLQIIGISNTEIRGWQIYDPSTGIQGWCNRWYLAPTLEDVPRIEQEIVEEMARLEAEKQAYLQRLIPGTNYTGTLIGSDFIVTTYTPSPSENGGTSNNCFGESLWNWLDQTVAVDRRVIPLKTWIYIEGIGKRQTRDTGVIGHHIDVLTTRYSNKWTNRKVWILD